MTALINRFHVWLSFKVSLVASILAALAFLAEFIIYAAGGLSPTIWTGKCSVLPPSRDTVYAECLIDGVKVTDSIKLKLFYEVAVNHKDLTCEADSFKNLRCYIIE